MAWRDSDRSHSSPLRTVLRPMDATSAIFAEAHRRLVRLLCGRSGCRVGGFVAGVRHAKLPPWLRKRLLKLDAAAVLVRHIIHVHVESLGADVTAALAALPAACSALAPVP